MAIPLIWLLTTGNNTVCDMREWLHPLHAGKDRLGLIISRFDNDPDNLGQEYFAAALDSDRTLIQHVSVMTTCRVFGITVSDDASRSYANLRRDGQALLKRADALVLLWGRVDDNRLRVRFVSTRRDDWPAQLRLMSMPLQIREDRLEIPLSLNQPDLSLLDIKTLALELMNPGETSRLHVRASLVKAYDESQESVTALPAVVAADSPPLH